MHALFQHRTLLQTVAVKGKKKQRNTFSNNPCVFTKKNAVNESLLTNCYLMNSKGKSHSLKKHVIHCGIFLRWSLWLKFHCYSLHVHFCQLHRTQLYLQHRVQFWFCSNHHRLLFFGNYPAITSYIIHLIDFSSNCFFRGCDILRSCTLLMIPLSSIQSVGIWNSLQFLINDSLIRRRL